jgi:hypothetical protein
MVQIKSTIESKDYESWLELMKEDTHSAKMLEKINADNFSKFQEMLNAKMNGDLETAKSIAQELGLRNRN